MKVADWIQSESWVDVFNEKGASEMATSFHSLVHSKIEQLCPSKTININALKADKPQFPSVEKLARQKKRVYNLKGNCPKYKELKKQMKEKIKTEGAKIFPSR